MCSRIMKEMKSKSVDGRDIISLASTLFHLMPSFLFEKRKLDDGIMKERVAKPGDYIFGPHRFIFLLIFLLGLSSLFHNNMAQQIKRKENSGPKEPTFSIFQIHHLKEKKERKVRTIGPQGLLIIVHLDFSFLFFLLSWWNGKENVGWWSFSWHANALIWSVLFFLFY